MIKTTNLTKVFYSGFLRRRVVALNSLSLTVRQGEIFGYLGPNGAGKTTSIKLFVGLLHPTSGRVEIMNEDIGNPLIRRKIGYLPESPYFYEYLTAEEFLNFCASIYYLSKNICKERIKFLLNLTDLYEARSKQLREFSKGMLQKIGIVQALIGDPELIILDEPMMGLDPVGRKKIRDLIFKLKEEKKTVFFSTHILSDVEDVCDRVGILVGGELRSCGKLDDMLKEEGVQIEVVLSGVSPQLSQQVRSFSSDLNQREGEVILKLSDETKLNNILKFCLDNKLNIESITRQRKTLEEIFLKEIA